MLPAEREANGNSGSRKVKIDSDRAASAAVRAARTVICDSFPLQKGKTEPPANTFACSAPGSSIPAPGVWALRLPPDAPNPGAVRRRLEACARKGAGSPLAVTDCLPFRTDTPQWLQSVAAGSESCHQRAAIERPQGKFRFSRYHYKNPLLFR